MTDEVINNTGETVETPVAQEGAEPQPATVQGGEPEKLATGSSRPLPEWKKMVDEAAQRVHGRARETAPKTQGILHYQANKQDKELELPKGLSVEAGSEGEKRLKEWLAGHDALLDLKQRAQSTQEPEQGYAGESQQEVADEPQPSPDKDTEFVNAMREMSENLRALKEQTQPSKQEAKEALDEADLDVRSWLTREENALYQKHADLYGEDAAELHYAPFAIRNIREAAVAEQRAEAAKANEVMRNLEVIHSLDNTLPDPHTNPQGLIGKLTSQGGFLNWLLNWRRDMNIPEDAPIGNIHKWYQMYQNDTQSRKVAANGSVNGQQQQQTPMQSGGTPVPHNNKELLKIAQNVSGGDNSSVVGREFNENEFWMADRAKKKQLMRQDYRYYNMYARANGMDEVSSNEELRWSD